MFLTSTIIAIEGPDRVGKETQAKMLVEELSRRGFNVEHVEAPIRSLITYRLIYWMLRNGYAVRFPFLFQTIQFVNKIMFQIFRLSLLRWRRSFIVFDRWALSACVYGLASNVNTSVNFWMFNRLRQPDVTLILKGDSFEAPERAKDSYEANNEFQANVRSLYDKLGYMLECDFVDASGSRDDVHSQIMNILNERDVL